MWPPPPWGSILCPLFFPGGQNLSPGGPVAPPPRGGKELETPGAGKIRRGKGIPPGKGVFSPGPLGPKKGCPFGAKALPLGGGKTLVPQKGGLIPGPNPGGSRAPLGPPKEPPNWKSPTRDPPTPPNSPWKFFGGTGKAPQPKARGGPLGNPPGNPKEFPWGKENPPGGNPLDPKNPRGILGPQRGRERPPVYNPLLPTPNNFPFPPGKGFQRAQNPCRGAPGGQTKPKSFPEKGGKTLWVCPGDPGGPPPEIETLGCPKFPGVSPKKTKGLNLPSWPFNPGTVGEPENPGGTTRNRKRTAPLKERPAPSPKACPVSPKVDAPTTKAGPNAWQVEGEGQDDHRRDLARCVRDNGWLLLGMERQAMSLEDVFRKLTTE